MFSLRLFFFAVICLALPFSVFSAYSCLCGCCNANLKGGICLGNSVWNGWTAQNAAQCSGDGPADVSFCNSVCTKTYPNLCAGARVLSNCQETAPSFGGFVGIEKHEEAKVEPVVAQAAAPAAPAFPIRVTDNATLYLELQASLTKIATQAMKELSPAEVKELYLQWNETSSVITPAAVEAAVGGPYPPNPQFPWLANMACECQCCVQGVGLAAYKCIPNPPTAVVGYLGIPVLPMPIPPNAWVPWCSTYCQNDYGLGKLSYQCPFPNGWITGNKQTARG